MSAAAPESIAHSTNWKVPATVGYATILLTFFGMGGWSAFAALDSAVIAPGVVAVESNRKTIQHYEGGIVREVLVAEGDSVEAGQVLFRLDPTQASANVAINRSQYRFALVQEARLQAERSLKNEVTFPQEVMENSRDPLIAREIADQLTQFEEHQKSLSGQTEIIESRIQQLHAEIGGLELEQSSAKGQLSAVLDQMKSFDSLLKKGLIQKSTVVQLQRDQFELEGVVGRTTANIAKAKSSIAEAKLEKIQLTRKFAEEASVQIADVRQKLAELRERSAVAADVLQRLEVKAPLSGTVQNLKIFTQGAVIRPGDPLLDIVPSNGVLIVEANVSPLNVDNIASGMGAEIRFPSFQSKRLPAIFGNIRSVSRDRLTDEKTGEPYFRVRIAVNEDMVPEKVHKDLSAGLPAEVIIPTGERSALQYIIDPLQDRLRTSFREE